AAQARGRAGRAGGQQGRTGSVASRDGSYLSSDPKGFGAVPFYLGVCLRVSGGGGDSAPESGSLSLSSRDPRAQGPEPGAQVTCSSSFLASSVSRRWRILRRFRSCSTG